MTWSTDDTARLCVMFVDQEKPARDIAIILGRSEKAVRSQLRRLGLQRARTGERAWSAEETARLARMVADGVPDREIAVRLGRSIHAVIAKRFHMRRAAGDAPCDRAHVRALAERDHRLSLPPRSLTAALMGDPEPGRSALDRQGGQR